MGDTIGGVEPADAPADGSRPSPGLDRMSVVDADADAATQPARSSFRILAIMTGLCVRTAKETS